MVNRLTRRSVPWILVAAIVAAMSAGWLLAPPAAAGELDKLETSLKLIPHDAAFYSSMLRNREQIEAIAGSRAWAKLKAMPVVQMGLMMYTMQAADPASVPGQIEAARKDPQVRQLIDLLGDMVSDEIFLYGDESFVDFLELLQQFAGTMRYGPMMLMVTGRAEGVDEDELQGMLLLATLCENLELLKVPDMIVGFKLSSPDQAKEQLKKLEALAAALLENEPQLEPLKGRFKSTKVAGHEYLTLALDGRMIPWEEVPLEDLERLEANQGDAEKLIAHLKQSKLVIALGVRDDYLLLSIGSSTGSLARLGKGKGLIDRPELKPLEKFAQRRLVSISYVSEPLMARVGNSKEDIDDLLEVVNQMLPLAELKPEQQARIRKHAAALAEDIKRMIPEPGAVMAFNFLTPRGIEGYGYNWGEQITLDGSKPLGLLRHLGGNPFLAAVGRGKHSPGDYDLLVKWIKVAYGYFREFALPEMTDDDREQFDRVVELFGPLVNRMDQINRKMLIPALADGQAAVVFDAKLTSKQFISALPPTEKPMPMIEPALVIGVSDAELLRKAIVEYRKVLNGVIDAIRKLAPGSIPNEYEIPSPRAAESEVGTIYSYGLPEEWGLDKRIVPSFGLSETAAVFSLTQDHTRRLLRATPLKIGGILGKAERPLAVAVLFDWAGLVEAATPWVNLAVERISEEFEQDPDTSAAIASQVGTALEVLKVLRTVTSESYFEGEALVTHSLMEVRDLEE